MRRSLFSERKDSNKINLRKSHTPSSGDLHCVLLALECPYTYTECVSATIISYAKIVGGVNDGEDDVKDYSVFSGERQKRTAKCVSNRK